MYNNPRMILKNLTIAMIAVFLFLYIVCLIIGGFENALIGALVLGAICLWIYQFIGAIMLGGAFNTRAFSPSIEIKIKLDNNRNILLEANKKDKRKINRGNFWNGPGIKFIMGEVLVCIICGIIEFNYLKGLIESGELYDVSYDMIFWSVIVIQVTIIITLFLCAYRQFNPGSVTREKEQIYIIGNRLIYKYFPVKYRSVPNPMGNGLMPLKLNLQPKMFSIDLEKTKTYKDSCNTKYLFKNEVRIVECNDNEVDINNISQHDQLQEYPQGELEIGRWFEPDIFGVLEKD